MQRTEYDFQIPHSEIRMPHFPHLPPQSGRPYFYLMVTVKISGLTPTSMVVTGSMMVARRT